MTLLLTGASGFVGGGLLRILAPGRRIVALSRRPVPGVEHIQADVTHPLPELDVTGIIHAAAETRFDRPLEEARRVNVRGTENALALARRSKRLTMFVHLSTAYVVGKTEGAFPERAAEGAREFSNTYQQSKFEAEALVVEAMRGLPASIVRLSTIVGDSSGRVTQFNFVHRLLRMLTRNVLPVAPGRPEARIDLVPSDWAIPIVAELCTARFAPGLVHHVCAGAAGSLPVAEMRALTAEVFESHPKARRFLPLNLPRLVPLSEFEAFASAKRRKGDRLMNEVLRVLGTFIAHLGLRQEFENGSTAGLRPFPDPRATFRRVLSHCLETDWGKNETGRAGPAGEVDRIRGAS